MVSQGLNRQLTPDIDAVLRRQQDPTLLFTTQYCPPPACTRLKIGKPILDGSCLLDLDFCPAGPAPNVELNDFELVGDGDARLRIQGCSRRQALASDIGQTNYSGDYFICGRLVQRDKNEIGRFGIAGR
jgi:hypothetical protein